ncbi:hypothetical protein HaLaN_22455, partial [Haematococcus lacustris]
PEAGVAAPDSPWEALQLMPAAAGAADERRPAPGAHRQPLCKDVKKPESEGGSAVSLKSRTPRGGGRPSSLTADSLSGVSHNAMKSYMQTICRCNNTRALGYAIDKRMH